MYLVKSKCLSESSSITGSFRENAQVTIACFKVVQLVFKFIFFLVASNLY